MDEIAGVSASSLHITNIIYILVFCETFFTLSTASDKIYFVQKGKDSDTMRPPLRTK